MLRDRIPQSAELHLSPETKQILFYANDESRQLKNRHIGPEHLLLGIVREESSIAAEILLRYRTAVQDVRDEMARQSGSQTVPLAAERQVQDAEPAGIYPRSDRRRRRRANSIRLSAARPRSSD